MYCCAESVLNRILTSDEISLRIENGTIVAVLTVDT